tara:strand:- start:1358 stop:2035 length:678 start_codon:yes stop_codon:yes gene_type:complete
MSNSEFPHLLKIGKSKKDPTQYRVNELNQTGVPQPFRVEYYACVGDEDLIERLCHEHFFADRPNKAREFFNVDCAVAINSIRDLANNKSSIKYEEVFFISPEDLELQRQAEYNKKIERAAQLQKEARDLREQKKLREQEKDRQAALKYQKNLEEENKRLFKEKNIDDRRIRLVYAVYGLSSLVLTVLFANLDSLNTPTGLVYALVGGLAFATVPVGLILIIGSLF